MVNFCAVIGCSNRADRDKSTSFFRLPAVITNQGEETRERSRKRRQQWLANINRPDMKESSYPYVRICSDHFIAGKPSTLYETGSPDWAPTLNLGHDKDKSSSRKVRRKRKVLVDSTDSIPPLSACNPDLQICSPFLNLPLEPYNHGVFKPLESKEAMELLWLPDEIYFDKPPCQPASGEIYLLKIGPLQEAGDWKKDGYEWVKRSSSVLTINRNPALKKFSFYLSSKNPQDGLSRKHVYRLFSNNRKFVIHYLGSDERQTSVSNYQQAEISEVTAMQSGRSEYYRQLANDSQQSDSIYWDLTDRNNDKQLQSQQIISETIPSENGTELVSVELSNHDPTRMKHFFSRDKVRSRKRSANNEINRQQQHRMFSEMIPMQLPVDEMPLVTEGVELHPQRGPMGASEQRRVNANVSALNNDSIIIDEHEAPSSAKIPRMEANFISHVPMNEVRFHSQPLITSSEKEKRTLVVPNHQVSVMSNMFSLWKTGRLCDTYISNGTTNILIHKMVLGAVCPKVLSVLYSSPSNVFSKVTFPSSVSKEALLAFVEYMYSGVLNLDEDILSQLKIIAQRLDMKDFEQVCTNELRKIRITSLLSTIMEPILSEPASFSGLLSNSKKKTTPTTRSETPQADFAPVLKLLENSYFSSRSQPAVSKKTTSAVATAAAVSDPSVLIPGGPQGPINPASDNPEINIKSEDDDNGCVEIMHIENNSLKIEPNDSCYGINDNLFLHFNSIPSNVISDSHLAASSINSSNVGKGNGISKNDDGEVESREISFGYPSGQGSNPLGPSSPEIVNLSDLNEAQLPRITSSDHASSADENSRSRLVGDNDNELDLVPISSITQNQSISDSSHVDNTESLSYGTGLVPASDNNGLISLQESDSLVSSQTPYPVGIFAANQTKTSQEN